MVRCCSPIFFARPPRQGKEALPDGVARTAAGAPVPRRGSRMDGGVERPAGIIRIDPFMSPVRHTDRSMTADPDLHVLGRVQMFVR
ncbi:hypothetical protein KRMM14A1004_13440 [Krasilnikovia sp. MM14-A1004]